ncbi:MAG: hypothetical protein DRG78_04175 [Epsilonproteobacteria bacterium]|nr:MAG: hypothetical protein DRG78_04175 [Campylobacterota bacterium]
MMKKISFDIDERVFENLKIVLKKSNIGQGEFLRKAVDSALEAYNKDFMDVYVIEDGLLVRKTIDIDEYGIEIDDSALSQDLKRDFEFIRSGFLIKNGAKTRFYSKMMLLKEDEK